MQAQIVDNSSRIMATVLSGAIEGSQDVKIAVAFATQSGFSLIWGALEIAMTAGAYAEFIIGLDNLVTDPTLLENLHALNRASDHVTFYCYTKEKQHGIYHPKLYLMRTGDEAVSIIGSSNLTEWGLRKNVEINVALSGTIQDEVISDSYTAYNLLKFDRRKVEPTEAYLATYKEARKRQQSTTRRDPVLRELLAQLEEQAQSLRRPKPTRRDVVGWLELVYDALPEGEFTNTQAYLNEQDFQRRYPNNRNIRAKIRQQLQVLRDMGMIKQLTSGRWQKL